MAKDAQLRRGNSLPPHKLVNEYLKLDGVGTRNIVSNGSIESIDFS